MSRGGLACHEERSFRGHNPISHNAHYVTLAEASGCRLATLCGKIGQWFLHPLFAEGSEDANEVRTYQSDRQRLEAVVDLLNIIEVQHWTR